MKSAATIAGALDALAIPYVFMKAPAPDEGLRVALPVPSRFALAQLLNRLVEAGATSIAQSLDATDALRTLDRTRRLAFELESTPVELRLPKIAPLAKALLERSKLQPHPEHAPGIRVASPEDDLLARLLDFNEVDQAAGDALLQTTPELDLGYVAISLGLVLPPESDRSQWLAAAARRHGFVKP